MAFWQDSTRCCACGGVPGGGPPAVYCEAAACTAVWHVGCLFAANAAAAAAAPSAAAAATERASRCPRCPARRGGGGSGDAAAAQRAEVRRLLEATTGLLEAQERARCWHIVTGVADGTLPAGAQAALLDRARSVLLAGGAAERGDAAAAAAAAADGPMERVTATWAVGCAVPAPVPEIPVAAPDARARSPPPPDRPPSALLRTIDDDDDSDMDDGDVDAGDGTGGGGERMSPADDQHSKRRTKLLGALLNFRSRSPVGM